MVIVTGSVSQIIAVSQLPQYARLWHRRLSLTSEPEVRSVTGVDRAWRDADLTVRNASFAHLGRNVTVAVFGHWYRCYPSDLSGKVMRASSWPTTQSVVMDSAIQSMLRTAKTLISSTVMDLCGGVIAGTGIQSTVNSRRCPRGFFAWVTQAI